MDAMADFLIVDKSTSSGTDSKTQPLLNIYQEICKSVHDIDDFRMKLLGLLPLTSLIGIFALGKDSLFATQSSESKNLIFSIGIFASFLTFSLFIYEIRGIIRCHDLICRGKEIEDLLGVKGQFYVCMRKYDCKNNDWTEWVTNRLDATLAACVIYSSIITVWIFTALHFGLNWTINGCVFWAILIGSVIGIGTFLFIDQLVRSRKDTI